MDNTCTSAETALTRVSTRRKQVNYKTDSWKGDIAGRSCLHKAFNKVTIKSRNDLLFKTPSKTILDSNITRLIVRFSNQHKQIREIIQRHWSILTDDSKIQKFVANAPSITFGRAMSIKDRLVTSEFRGESTKEHCPAKGFFPCGHCSQCPLIKKEKTFLLPNGERFSPSLFVNCCTRGIVYMMLCECN